MSEKRPLLKEEEAEEAAADSKTQIQAEYGSSSSSSNGDHEQQQQEAEAIPEFIAGVPCLVTVYTNRARIPGYGLWRLFRQASLYSLYVLIIMLCAYLLNQLDRYTLPITAKYVGFDLKFGDLRCLPNFTELLSPEYNIPRSVVYTDIVGECRNSTRLTNSTNCFEYESVVVSANGTDFTTNPCVFTHDGSAGLDYQILAGPVFNNVYPLAGILAGILADTFNRKILLTVSLAFWSIATGVTGFASSYWMLVVFRILLAIGAAGCSPFAVGIIADYFPQSLRGTALGIYYFGIYVGYSLAFAIGNEINIILNWRWVFFISAILGLALVPVVLFTVKDKRPQAEVVIATDRRPRRKCTEWFDEQFRSFVRKLVLILVTFVMPGMLMLCIAGGIRNAGGYVWAYNTEAFFQQFYPDTIIASFMSIIPLVAGSIGAMVGGVISDLLVKNRGPYARIWVLIVSQLLAAPFAAGALFLPFPWDFLSLIPSNVIGEMWVGVTSAIVVDLAPTRIRTTAIAVYLFLITVIGGNFNAIVAPIKEALPGGSTTQYRWALFITFPMVYVFSSVLFLATFFLMRLDLRIKSKTEDWSTRLLVRQASPSREEYGSPDNDEEYSSVAKEE